MTFKVIKNLNTDKVIVWFSAIDVPRGKFTGETWAKNSEFSYILVNPEQNSWYLNPLYSDDGSVQKSADKLNELLKAEFGSDILSNTLFYGSSMGGTGALIFASYCKPKYIVAAGFEWELGVRQSNSLKCGIDQSRNEWIANFVTPKLLKLSDYSNIYLYSGSDFIHDQYSFSYFKSKSISKTLFKNYPHTIALPIEVKVGVGKFIEKHFFSKENVHEFINRHFDIELYDDDKGAIEDAYEFFLGDETKVLDLNNKHIKYFNFLNIIKKDNIKAILIFKNIIKNLSFGRLIEVMDAFKKSNIKLPFDVVLNSLISVDSQITFGTTPLAKKFFENIEFHYDSTFDDLFYDVYLKSFNLKNNIVKVSFENLVLNRLRKKFFGKELEHNYWDSFNSGVKSDFDTNKLSNVNVGEVCTVLNIIKIKDIKNIGISKHKVSQINNNFNSFENFIDFYKGALKYNYIEIINPFHGENNKIKSNINFIVGHFNFIRFEGQKETFYLIQSFDTCCGLFFPRTNAVIFFNTLVNTKPVEKFISFLIRNSSKVIESVNATNKIFTGFYIAHSRPWHYYYNILNGYIALHKNLNLTRKKIIVRKGGDFLNLEPFLPSHSEIIKIDGTNYFEKLNSSSFVLFPGIRFNLLTPELDEKFSEEIKKIALTNYSMLTELDYIDKITFNKKVIWIGITSQKRTWLEQREGIIEFITKVLSENKNKNESVLFLFDGWTNPVSYSKMDVQQALNDQSVVNEITSELNRLNIDCFSLVGKTSLTKIAWAQKANLCIVNHASGSIHCCKFSNSPAVTHLNTIMPKKHHFHRNSIEFPDNLIQDIKSNSSVKHAISYSISPSDFAHFSYENYLNNKQE